MDQKREIGKKERGERMHSFPISATDIRKESLLPSRYICERVTRLPE